MGMLDFLFSSPEIPQLHGDPFVESTRELRQRELQYIDAIHAGCPYTYVAMKQAIHLFKYRRIPKLCQSISQLIIDAEFEAGDAVLCPVPLHWTRLYWRGFNQAELLAGEVGGACSLPVQSLLKRTRPTGHQAHRTRADRLTAVRNAFVCTETIVPKHVILIDDLATTGATLDACAAALKRAGAERVEGWVVAHG